MLSMSFLLSSSFTFNYASAILICPSNPFIFSIRLLLSFISYSTLLLFCWFSFSINSSFCSFSANSLSNTDWLFIVVSSFSLSLACSSLTYYVMFYSILSLCSVSIFNFSCNYVSILVLSCSKDLFLSSSNLALALTCYTSDYKSKEFCYWSILSYSYSCFFY